LEGGNQAKISYASLDALFENRKGPENCPNTAVFGGQGLCPGPLDPGCSLQFNPPAFMMAQNRAAQLP
jgi:hypothetical protein